MNIYHSEVVADYADALRKDLTFNSKPHINNLTTIAKENIDHAKGIVTAIEDRIRTAPPLEKLPSLYLLDSIVKNIGGPYSSEFGRNIVETFCSAFDAIKENQEQRNVYLRLLKTWVGPHYFPPQAIAEIENRVFVNTRMNFQSTDPGRPIHVNPRFFQPGAQQQQLTPPPHQQQPHHLPPQQHQQQLQQRTGFPLQQQQQQFTMPARGVMQQQQPVIGAYGAIGRPVHGAPIIGGMNTTVQHQPNPSLNPYQRALTPPLAASSQFHQPLLNGATQKLPTAVASGNPYQQHLNPYSNAPRIASPPPLGTAIVNTSTVQQTQPPIANTNMIADILARLNDNKQQTSFTATITTPRQKEEEQQQNRVSNATSASDSEIERGIYELYDSFPLQCSTCALRFREKDDLNSHLDKHFQTSSLKATHKVLSRKWYQNEPDWIKEIDMEVMQDPGAIFFKQMDEEKKKSSEMAVEYNLSSFISSGSDNIQSSSASDVLNSDSIIEPVIANDHTTCPLCKDEFETKFDDDVQEWVLIDAVKDRNTGLVAHRICLPSLLAQSLSSSTSSTSSKNNKRGRDEEQEGTTTTTTTTTLFDSSPPLKRIKTE